MTQSNTCALYLGAKLGIDAFGGDLVKATTNHTVLDQTMDLRNDLMKVVYPFGSTKTPEEFPEAFKKHFAKSASATLKKLEGFIGAGPFVLGADPRSGDFMLFEMRGDRAEFSFASDGRGRVATAYRRLRGRVRGPVAAAPRLRRRHWRTRPGRGGAAAPATWRTRQWTGSRRRRGSEVGPARTQTGRGGAAVPRARANARRAGWTST